MPNIDLTRILTGDWLGSAITAAATIATAFALSVLLLALMYPNGASPSQFLTAATLTTGAAFGGDILGHTHNYGDGHISFGIYPLTVTFAALTVTALLLSRQLRRYTNITGAITHAIRTAVLLAAALIALTLSARTYMDFPDGFGNVGMPKGAGLYGLSGNYHSNTAAAATIAALLTLLVAATLILRNHPGLPTPLRHARTWITTPIQSVAVIVAAATAVGIIAGALLLATNPDTRNTSTIAIWLAALPNLGITALYLGTGAAFQKISTSNEPLNRYHQTYHLASFADHTTNWVWILPAATLLTLAASAWYVARRSTNAHTLQADMLRWFAAVVIATPFLTHVAADHSHYKYGVLGTDYIHANFGINAWQAIGLAAIWTFAIAVITAGLARTRTAETQHSHSMYAQPFPPPPPPPVGPYDHAGAGHAPNGTPQ